MSYAFTVEAPTKEEAKQKVAAEFDAILQAQPVHEVDLTAARAAAAAYVDVLNEPKSAENVRVQVNGYVSWRGQMDEKDFTGATVTVGAHLVLRDEA